MIELLFLVVSGLVMSSWVVMVIFAMTLADLRTINLEKELQRHPGARKWRNKPLVSVIGAEGASEQSIRSGSYRHVTIMKSSNRIRGKVVLELGAGDILEKTALRDANAHFQFNTETRFVEIIPRLAFPQTIRELFAGYRTMALAPFVRVRAALNVRPNHRQWPRLSQKKLVKNRLEQWYGVYVWLLGVVNVALLLYVGYIAIALDQPDYLMAYMTAFGLWLAWSITNHPLLVARQKIAYLFLAPVSFGYFLWRAFIAPFTPLHRVDYRPFVRQMLSLDI